MDKFSEAEAATRLNISKSTLVRERMAGRIHPIRIGQRVIHYTQAILDEYEQRCRNVSEKSEITGLASGQVPSSGAGRGSTKPLDKHDAHLLAQRMFKRAS